MVHDCPLSRSVGYFLEPVVALAPFSKQPLMLTLRGITTDEKDLSVDIIRTVTLPHLAMFGIDDGLEMKVGDTGYWSFAALTVVDQEERRATRRWRRDTVYLSRRKIYQNPQFSQRRQGQAYPWYRVSRPLTTPTQLTSSRHAVRVSPQFSNRMVDASRSILNRYIPDLYIHSDVYKGEDSGKSPGYALSLLAETTEGVLYCSEAVSVPRPDPHSLKANKVKKDKMFQDEEKDEGPVPTTPEDVALTASRELLIAVQRGGCVDRKHQWMVLLYMVLGSEDVGRVKMGQLSPRR